MEIFLANFFRALGLISFLPLDWLTAGYGLKLILSFVLTVVGSLGISSRIISSPLEIPLEFFIGFTQILPLLLILHTVELLADLIESARGQTLATVFSPLMQSESCILPILLRGAFWSLLLQAGVIPQIIANYFAGLTMSFDDFNLWNTALRNCLEILPLGMIAALPFCYLLLIIELGIIILSKIVPSLSLDCVAFFCRMLITGSGVLILINTDYFSLLTQIYFSFSYGRT
jgi:hypothetical protein